MKRGSYLLCVLSLALVTAGLGQNKPGTELAVRKATGTIRIDGLLDESDWVSADVATGMYLNFPTDTLPANFQTEARVTFDDQFLYIGFVCHDDQTPSVVQSLRRDFEWSMNDNVGLYFDPYNDYTNGFFFGISPFGVQREGIMSGGGIDPMNNFNINWDNKWYSEVTRHSDKWIAEIAIPFKSIRYNRGVPWNISFLRQDLKRNQVSSWIRTPIQNMPASFPFSGKLVFETELPPPGTNISLIPYVIGSSYRDKENGTPLDLTANAGFDAKIGITQSMNLDLTVNPDFSTVDVDRQIVNLTRYEFQYPERRQFFLENSDLFSAPGFTTYTQPFFSRRIGLIPGKSGDLQRVPISYGARISGKIGSDWRLGVMNLQTARIDSLGLPVQNYSVGVLQRQVLSRSTLGFVMINKQSDVRGEYDSDRLYHPSVLAERKIGGQTDTVLNRFNRVIGADFNWVTRTNKWGGKIYHHRSFDDFRKGSDHSSGLFVNLNKRNIQLGFGGVASGKDFVSQVGFMPGQELFKGYWSPFVVADFPIYLKSPKVVQVTPGLETGRTYRLNGQLAEINTIHRVGIKWRNTAEAQFSWITNYQYLPSDFNPLFPKGDSTLLAGQDYWWDEFRAEFTSNTRRLLTMKLAASGGEYYNGNRLGVGGTVTYRVQPYGNFSVTWDYNDIRLPGDYGRAQFLLLSPRLDLTLSRQVFLTSFLQYNDRFNNVNLNTRLQWRFKPASDFFVVYSENYLPGSMASKNRSLVVKLTYWFNL